MSQQVLRRVTAGAKACYSKWSGIIEVNCMHKNVKIKTVNYFTRLSTRTKMLSEFNINQIVNVLKLMF